MPISGHTRGPVQCTPCVAAGRSGRRKCLSSLPFALAATSAAFVHAPTAWPGTLPLCEAKTKFLPKGSQNQKKPNWDRVAQVRPTSFPPYARHLHQTSRSGAATCPRSRSRRSCSSRPASPVWARCSTGSIGFSSRARCVCVLARLFFARTPPWSLSRLLGRTPLLRLHEVGRGYGSLTDLASPLV